MSNDILTKFFTEIGSLLESAKDFATTEIPEVAKEVLHYHAAKDGVFLFVGLFVLILAYVLDRKFTKMYADSKIDAADAMALFMVEIIAVIAAAVSLIVNTLDLFEILFAPRLHLIEYFAALVRHSNH